MYKKTENVKKLSIHMRNRKQLEDSDHVVTSDPFGTFASKFVLLEFENFQILRKSSKHVSCSQAFPSFFTDIILLNPKDVKKLHSFFI